MCIWIWKDENIQSRGKGDTIVHSNLIGLYTHVYQKCGDTKFSVLTGIVLLGDLDEMQGCLS